MNDVKDIELTPEVDSKLELLIQQLDKEERIELGLALIAEAIYSISDEESILNAINKADTVNCAIRNIFMDLSRKNNFNQHKI